MMSQHSVASGIDHKKYSYLISLCNDGHNKGAYILQNLELKILCYMINI